MIKVIECNNTDRDFHTYKIVAFADTKDEVDTTPISDYVGMPKNANVEMSSLLITADGDVAFRKSDDTWNWVE